MALLPKNHCIFVKNYRAMKKGCGLYNDASEAVVDRLQLLEEGEACQQLLKEAIIEGVESGIPLDLTPKSILKH